MTGRFRKLFCITVWAAMVALLQSGVVSILHTEDHFKDEDVKAVRLVADNSPSVLLTMEQRSSKDNRKLPLGTTHAIQGGLSCALTFHVRLDSLVPSAPLPFQHSFILRL